MLGENGFKIATLKPLGIEKKMMWFGSFADRNDGFVHFLKHLLIQSSTDPKLN